MCGREVISSPLFLPGRAPVAVSRAHLQSLGESEKSSHFRPSLYPTALLNLNCSLIFLAKSFFSVLSSLESSKAPGTRALKSLAPLLTLLQGNIPRSSLACRYKPFCRVQGAAKLTLREYLRKIILARRSNILTQWPAHVRALRCLSYGAGGLLKLLVRDIYCELFIALIEQLFLPLHFSCPLSQGGRDSLLSGGG